MADAAESTQEKLSNSGTSWELILETAWVALAVARVGTGVWEAVEDGHVPVLSRSGSVTSVPPRVPCRFPSATQ